MTAASKMASEEDECPGCSEQVYQAEAYLAGTSFRLCVVLFFSDWVILKLIFFYLHAIALALDDEFFLIL